MGSGHIPDLICRGTLSDSIDFLCENLSVHMPPCSSKPTIFSNISWPAKVTGTKSKRQVNHASLANCVHLCVVYCCLYFSSLMV